MQKKFLRNHIALLFILIIQALPSMTQANNNSALALSKVENSTYTNDSISPFRAAIDEHLKTKSTVKVELFVMSQCPYGVRAEDALIPILKAYKQQIDCQIYYIASVDKNNNFKSLNGQAEVDEDMRQVVISKIYPQLYLDYLLARNKNYQSNDWKTVAQNIGISPLEVENIVHSTEGKNMFMEAINPALNRDIHSSPSIFIEGQKFKGRISPIKIKAVAHNGANKVDKINSSSLGATNDKPLSFEARNSPFDNKNDVLPQSSLLGFCGDGSIDDGEDCDEGDGNYNGEYCTPSCRYNECGDGEVYNGIEECDEGDDNNGVSCTSSCVYPRCGDGSLNGFGNEECDDGNFDDNDECKNDCTQNFILPVELISFTAISNGNQAQLTWQTASEQNVKNFDIEKSLDGKSFKKIGDVRANNTPSVYQAVDKNFFTSAYYRLKTNDVDGQTEYSKVINLTTSVKGFSIRAYPNPFGEYLNVDIVTEKESDLTIELTNLLGAQIYQSKVIHTVQEMNTSIPTNTLSKGVYFLKISDGQKTLNHKIIKQ